MRGSRRHRTVVFALDCVLLVLCALGGYHYVQKAGIGMKFAEHNGRVYCLKVLNPVYDPYMRPGEVLRSVGGIEVHSVEEIEFLLDARRIGETLEVEIDGPNGLRTETLPVSPYYGPHYVLIASMVSGLFFLIGIVVYARRPADTAAILFHWGVLAAAAMIMTTWGRYTIEPAGLGYALRAVFFFAYSSVPTVFFHFTCVFPRNKYPGARKFIGLLYAAGLVLAGWTTWTFVEAASTGSVVGANTFLKGFNITRWFFNVLVISSLLNFVHSYRTALEEYERKRLRWVLWGLMIGLPPFVGLWVIPQILFSFGLVPEEVVLVLSAVIPITFGISIIKYRLMDIDLILNRSVVYGLVMGMLVGIYAAIVGVAAIVVTSLTDEFSFIISATAAIVVALLFEPARIRVQRFVDRRFFRVQYDFREAQRNLLDEVKHCLDVRQLAQLIVSRIDELFLVERIGFFTMSEPGGRLQLLAHKNYEILEKHGVRFESEKLKARLSMPVALHDRIEPGTPFESADTSVFRRWGMALVITVLSEEGKILGFLVLGEKKSGVRFTMEDIDLLNTVSAQAGLAIERITLQQRLLLEHAEARRLEDLSRLKSFFVSSVSHDLKTPLTSIKMFAELLLSGKKLKSKGAREYLEIIEGESDRLTRLINNVLDFAKIEQGVKEYHFSELKLNATVRSVLRSLQYQFKMEQCTVHAKLRKRELTVRADVDAVTEALINLFSNALKYSPKRKQITVTTFHQDGFAAVKVDDKGVGVPRDDLKSIFEPFFRAKQGMTQQVGGTGLGLALVRHMVEAHGGKIDVKSTPGKGSSFTLLFPMKSTV